jgi:hypothetical protein
MFKYRILMLAAVLLSLGIGGHSLVYAADGNDVNEPNEVPIANAGPDQTVFAGIDGTALVTLDGSDSNDPDHDISSFNWTWTIDGQPKEANGVAPQISLPVGVHVITLVVSDDNNVSAPDDVNVTVIAPLEVGMKFTPQTLNCKSNGKWVKAHMFLPEGFDVNDVNTQDVATIEPFGVPSSSFQVSADEENGNFGISFSRAALCLALGDVTTETVEVTVTGFLKSGQVFFGTDTIRLLDKAPKPLKVGKMDTDNSTKPKGKK